MVTIADALRAHVLLIDSFREGNGEGVGGIGPRDRGRHASAVDRQYVGLGNVLKWKDVYQWTATGFFGMVKNHPFHDGNKRTGLLLALWQLNRARRTPSVAEYHFERLAVATAGSNHHEVDAK